MGRVLHVFNCCSSIGTSLLRSVFSGVAATGENAFKVPLVDSFCSVCSLYSMKDTNLRSSDCWVCFKNVNRLQEEDHSVVAQLTSTLSAAVQSSKNAVQLGSEEVPVTRGGAVFFTMSDIMPVSCKNQKP